MMNRTMISFAVLWAFHALPSLCGAGLLPHFCEQHASDQCGHEHGCKDDPCAKFIASDVSSPLRADWLDSSNDSIAAPAVDVFSDADRVIQRIVPAIEPPHAILPAPGDRLPLLI